MSNPDVAVIVAKLKQRAEAHPWVPVKVPPKEHFRHFPNGLSICFTQDILPGGRYWHLSVARYPGGPTGEEVNFWRRAFFDKPPTIELPGQTQPTFSRHFHWRVNDGARKG